MNKKILIVDVVTFAINMLLFVLLRISTSFIGNRMFEAIIFGLLSLATAFVTTYIIWKKYAQNVEKGNVAVAVSLLIAVVLIYPLPFWGFLGNSGTNVAVNLAFIFTYFGRIWIYVSYLIRKRSRNVSYNIGNNSLASTKNYYKIIAYYGIGVMAVCSLFVIINMFIPLPDIYAKLLSNYGIL